MTKNALRTALREPTAAAVITQAEAEAYKVHAKGLRQMLKQIQMMLERE